MVTLEIDGKKVTAEEGTTILEAAQQVGIDIPYFCYHRDMAPYGGCRLCMVEVTQDGTTRLQPSCAHPVRENQKIRTDTERLIRGRKVIAELLLARCPDVDSVRNLAGSLGVEEARFTRAPSDCVLCGQCVRVCRNVVGVGAIDFVDRGMNRRVGTPYDLPSEDCVGCGSCAYVCPTGAMDMEYENVLRWRKLPGPMRKCRYMRMGFISHKVCPNNFQCWSCEVDQRMEDQAKTHPVFLLKESRAQEKETIDGFELLFDRFYDEAHVWTKRMDGTVRLGIDDFTRQLIGRIKDIRLPTIGESLTAKDPIWVISDGAKTLTMFSPMEGEVVDINPHVIENPALPSLAPYERGWILSMTPRDMLQTLRQMISGRAAKEWLTRDAHRLRELLGEQWDRDHSPHEPGPGGLAEHVDQSSWNKIEKEFFTRKKRKIRLRSVEKWHK